MADQADWNLTTSQHDEGVTFDFTGALDGKTISGRAIQSTRGLAVRSLHIDTDNPAGISTLFLRKIQLGEIFALSREVLNARIDHNAPEPTSGQPSGCACGCHPRPRKRPESSRYVTLDDAFLRGVALAYIEETTAGRGALGRMAVRFERPEMTVRTWIARARAADWLAPGASGRPSAEPGPKLLKSA